ncbi:putative neprosin [Rosa chinensis]|uniref:Putative neprosin n=1 Tax=Rosa chinensis TaxID=74649 RepID=A0A2P6RXR4_ROSCH|nr:putative neprosin [Rosa chinensis]
MGRGHFPHEGYGKASYFYHVQYADQPGSFKDATSLIPYATKPLCYDIIVFPPREGTSYGTNFFYGGPGYSSSCQT